MPAHRDRAQPGDSAPYSGPRWAYGPSGAIIDLDLEEAEAKRAEVRERTRRAEFEARRAEREVQAEELRRQEQAGAEQLDRELPDPLFPR